MNRHVFRKSTYSSGSRNCAEVALPGNTADVLIRDSKRPGAPVLRLGATTFAFFTRGTTTGHLALRG
ncbi:DUF397 domain-containing protein [Streptomyces sp. AV19]|uniref:DUF397 domain-containing protein n=1 Tax=Streptomyces sp. AV19 TaxID=2793068 RepID=UPI001F30E4B2|nr:DUF397 domain-containing protein [Streptomyces sp. AV19]MDG4534106.1 DUF397 domain-containing protein [Streptomyces sp. AV19]